MSELVKKILEHRKRNGTEALPLATGIRESTIDSIVGNWNGKHRKNTLDILYEFFALPKDAWYHENMKKWVKPTESVLGEIFRKKRLAMSLSIPDVSKRTRVGERQIARLEAGDSLPSFQSYTVTRLVDLYGFTEDERQKIRWFAVVLRDVVSINNSMD